MNVRADQVNPDSLDRLGQELSGRFGSRFTNNAAICDHHGHGLSHLLGRSPDAVVFPNTTEEVAYIVRTCRRLDIPLIPFGTGTSAEDHVAAVHGGLCVDLSTMNRVIAVNADDMDVVVQPGLTRKRLNEILRDTGLFFPIDPGADASIGGMVATRASGTNAVRYGTMRDNVLTLEAVLADGTVIRTGGRARKSSAGYDLTRLLVGSEGTLGVITEVTLKLHGIPETTGVVVASFRSIDDAARTVIEIMHAGISIARVELMDALQMRACRQYSKIDYPEAHCLFMEFHGSQTVVREQVQSTRAIAEDIGYLTFAWAETAAEKSSLWEARHNAYFAALALRPGAQGQPTDVCVPISRLAECINETRLDIEEHGLIAPICGHVGDGNFHVLLLVYRDRPDEQAAAAAFNDRLVDRALRMSGTSTGEHGIGKGKLKYMSQEHGPAVSVMRAVKHALDPTNILNPGKVIPAASAA
ncbi:FAD-linked oxidase C-terminal domain-containing protein [Bradyrhizobium sp. NP1]|uniref:FAD-binding oxidoreductase n=1 Tax=Bradyrhizobium sp. NP1 TaxID=3049772 RepID=UPI0025A50B8F|nr:FAD-linked oxidase C-terminal domain-containing protein [Bradyrhizobium sp. NP1]WJR75519.1 FAD-linked oxidase C-terminal domain-containing protein [Bradyrhizobium sp. NP1]